MLNKFLHKFIVMFFIVISLLTASCATKEVHFKNERLDGNELIKKEIRLIYFLGGLGADQVIKSSDICAKGVYSMENITSLSDAFIGLITAGLVTPRRIIFKCIKD